MSDIKHVGKATITPALIDGRGIDIFMKGDDTVFTYRLLTENDKFLGVQILDVTSLDVASDEEEG